MTLTLERAICPFCLRTVTLRAGGHAPTHFPTTFERLDYSQWCVGSGSYVPWRFRDDPVEVPLAERFLRAVAGVPAPARQA